MARKLTIVDDVEAGATPQNITTIPMASDVISLAQLPVSHYLISQLASFPHRIQNMLYAGCRSGEIRLFDVRSAESRLGGVEFLGGRFKKAESPENRTARKKEPLRNVKKSHSAITHLRLVRDWELLVATSAGNVSVNNESPSSLLIIGSVARALRSALLFTE